MGYTPFPARFEHLCQYATYLAPSTNYNQSILKGSATNDGIDRWQNVFERPIERIMMFGIGILMMCVFTLWYSFTLHYNQVM